MKSRSLLQKWSQMHQKVIHQTVSLVSCLQNKQIISGHVVSHARRLQYSSSHETCSYECFKSDLANFIAQTVLYSVF